MAEYIRKETINTNKPKPTSFEMIKNYRGSYGVYIDPYDFSMPARKIHFNHNTLSQRVPLKFALGVFITEDALKALEKGLFTFKDLQLLIEMAEEEGLYVPDSIKEPKILAKDLKEVLVKNDIQALEKIMMNATKNNIANLIAEARKNLQKLNLSMVSYIEKKYRVSLKTVDLNE